MVRYWTEQFASAWVLDAVDAVDAGDTVDSYLRGPGMSCRKPHEAIDLGIDAMRTSAVVRCCDAVLRCGAAARRCTSVVGSEGCELQRAGCGCGVAAGSPGGRASERRGQ